MSAASQNASRGGGDKGGSRGGWSPLILAASTAVPGVALALGLYGASSPAAAALFGLAILGAAFVLSWASDVLQLDVSLGLAIAVLALIAVLPEYVVDASFAWRAAEDPSQAALAVANMTGANRVLIGLAWPLVFAIFFFRTRRREIGLEGGGGLAVLALLAATLYAFFIVFKGYLAWEDLLVLGAVFAMYVWGLSRLPSGEPELIGPARAIGALREGRRRATAVGLTLAAAVVVLLVAEPFAEALVETGRSLGIDEFFLVQWAAPVASEAPELTIAAILAWRNLAGPALGALVSSKVNQWTLLLGMLPVVYAVALGAAEPFPLDERQRGELLLTAAQSLFAAALLLGLRLTAWGAGAIFVLFWAQFFLPGLREEMTVVYLAGAALVVVLERKVVRRTFVDVVRVVEKKAGKGSTGTEEN